MGSSGIKAAAPSKWDLEESFIGENAEPEFALQLNLSKDEFNGMELESPQKDLKEEEGPTTVLKKALQNIKEKDTVKKKKKKKKKVDSGADESSDEETAVKKKEKGKGKGKKKGKGLDFDIPEKTLKKLLKKNMLKKKALEKLMSGDISSKKKKKKTRKSTEFSEDEEDLPRNKSASKEMVRDPSEEDSEVERRMSPSATRAKKSRRERTRHADSD